LASTTIFLEDCKIPLRLNNRWQLSGSSPRESNISGVLDVTDKNNNGSDFIILVRAKYHRTLLPTVPTR
jgi:hypothetical protein